MHQDHYRRYLRGGHVTYGGVLLGVPALLAAAVLWSGSSSRPAQAFDPATMWLVSSGGHLVRANGLVDSAATQIIDRLRVDDHRDARLMNPAGTLVVTSAGGGLTAIDGRTHRRLGSAAAGAVSTVTDGTRLYRIGADTVDLLAPAGLAVLGTHRTGGPVSRWATSSQALYVTARDGSMTRIDGTGSSPVEGEAGPAPLLAGVADGVAAYDAGRGTISLVDGTSAEIVRRTPAIGATVFGAAPHGRSFAVVGGRELLVSTPDGEFRQRLTFDPGATDAPVLAGDRVYLTDPAAGRVHGFRLTDGLPEVVTLDFRAAGTMVIDVHRNREFVWFDDVRGRVAYAVRGGTAREVIKYAARPARTVPPTPRRSPASSPPPTQQTRPPSRPPRPAPSRTVRPSPSPSPDKSRKPSKSPASSKPPSRTPSRSASPSVDPRARCDGNETRLTVENRTQTGDRPRMNVRVCVAAPGNDEYWIVSVSGGNWFAKLEISGRVSEGPYRVRLLNGSGEPGQDRDFVVVAGRTGFARNWLRQNLAADETGEQFDREDLPAGAETVSERVATTS